MHTFILKVQLLLILHNLGIKCSNTFKENTTLFVDNGDTFVFNCTCFSESESAWKGPDGNDTVLTAYSNGLKINPYFNITNIFIYGNYTLGKCHLKIENYSTVNDGIYECSYFLSGNLHIQRYNVFSKRPPTNLKIVEASENNTIYGKEGVRIELKCTVKTGIPASTLFLSKEGLTVSNGRNDTLLYQFTPTRLDHMQNITCYALSELLTAPLSQTIYLDIQYGPSLKIIQQKKDSNIEGESVQLCCHSNSNPNVHYIGWAMNSHELNSWRQRGRMKVEGTRKVFCLRLSPLYRNHTGNHTCIAENSIAKSNSSIAINVLYPPDVKVSYNISEERITLQCIPDGKPDNYTYYDWKHKSEFKEDIRNIHGTPDGQLIINKSQSRKANEDDGIYVCTVFNGVPDLKGNFPQEGQTCIESIAPPVFVADNKPVEIGQFGKIVTLTIKIYDKLCNSTVLIKKNGTNVRIKPSMERIRTHDTFYGVNITAPGKQFIFHLHLASANDFTKYTVEACNHVGCSYFYVQVKSASCPEPPSNISVMATGQFVTVSWYPGYNGGFNQEFFIEFGKDLSLNCTVIVSKNESKEENMNYSLDNLSPNTAYFLRIFSRNKIGDSNKTDYVAFMTLHISQKESTFHRTFIVLPVVTTIGLCFIIGIGIVLYMKQKAKGSFGTNFSGTEDEYGSDTQESSVENRLYQSAEFLDPETRRREAELDNPIASPSHDNQLYQIQTYNENDGRSLQCALIMRVEELAVEPMPKITEADLNYAEIVFEDRQLPGPVIIHGIDNKTIYSDIVVGAQPQNLLSTNDSSSESEDDFIYVDGIENYTNKRKMIASQQ